MIDFWTNDPGERTLRRYTDRRAPEIAQLFRVRRYDELSATIAVSGGTQLFSATDQLTPGQGEAVAALWDAHARRYPVARRLNDPRRTLHRFELLAALHDAGLSRVRVYRAAEAGQVRVFPVFVRHTGRHGGLISPVLHSAEDLRRALRTFATRGSAVDDLMIAEFCDTSDADGWHRKYSAYRVGDRILPCHIMQSRSWIVRAGSNDLDEAVVRDEIDYLTRDPHQAWLRRVFDLAGVDYGRIDYGVTGGEPVAWEINVNPTLGRGSGGSRTGPSEALKALKAEAREIFHARLREAFAALAPAGAAVDAAEMHLPLERMLIERIGVEIVARERQQQRRHWLRRLQAHRMLLPIRAVFERWFPRRAGRP